MKRNFLLTICVFQIFLLMIMIFSVSYNLHQLDLIPTVSAEEGFNCCTETNDGGICQNVPSNYENCATELVPKECDSHPECQTGCCIDNEEGLCTTMSPREKCEEENGKWDSDKYCNILECQKGCCVLGGEVQFVTEKRCEYLSGIFGFEKDFRDLKYEYECFALSKNQGEGACVFEDKTCKFGTESECFNLGGEFSKGSLCSRSDLNTRCEKQASIGCVEGKDEIYWFDSCGNRENIYSSDRTASWNDGKVLLKSESCGAGSPNIDSVDCGNCDYFLGSQCTKSSSLDKKVKDGNFICGNLNCIDEKGKERSNGESWCVYDAFIGDGKDTVGSRHWKRVCINGEIQIEPCADYRGEICVQSEIKEDDLSFSIASCVMNEATLCLSYNSEEDKERLKKLCEENPQCTLKRINVDKYFKFDVCVGKYPKGIDLTGERYLESADLCSMATQTCEVVYVKDWKGKWNCKANCDCEKAEFSEQMNDLCISLGDCGSYINYIGEGTDNVKIRKAPSISWTDYKKYAEAIEGQYADGGDVERLMKRMGLYDNTNINQYEIADSSEKAVKFLGTVAGATGTAALAFIKATGTTIAYAAGEFFMMESTGFMAIKCPAVANVLGPVGAAAAGFAIGMMVGSYFAKSLGLTGTGAMVMALAGGAAGAFMTLQYFGYLAQLGPYGWIAALLVMAYVALVGWGKTKTVEVKFECYPWEAPLGNENCDVCNNDPLKPCSEYRCESLGQACKLIGEDTENPVCEKIADDSKPPIISIGEIMDDFIFTETKDYETRIKGKDKECITEFTPVVFSLITDEYAQCRYSFEKTTNYETMGEYPLELNAFTKNHTFVFSAPSIDSIMKSYNISEDARDLIEKAYSEMKIHVRCQDYHGNYNLKEYVVNFCVNDGPDLTAPQIISTNPKENTSIAYSITESNLDVYTNEPAECRIDSNDKIYEQMKNTMNCGDSLLNATDFGFKCSTVLYNLTEKENTFYIRCKDQPWMLDDSARNTNTESFIFTLKKGNELKLNSIEPSGEILSGFAPITVELSAETSGGSEDGEVICYYKFLGGEYIQFSKTYSHSHKSELNSIMGGEFNIAVRCKDDAGNVVENMTNFNVLVDSDAPIVVRVYNEDGRLILITDEDAECYYDFERCNFNEANATSMSATLTKEHSADFILGKVYHIKCKDIWGNSGSGCSIEVKSG
jgi:hypothetical protein